MRELKVMTLRFNVDFNELLESDLLMLSQTDLRQDVHGNAVQLMQGMTIEVQQESRYADDSHELLWARGVVEANTTGQWTHVKWCCRLDAYGISDRISDDINDASPQ